MTFKNKKEEFLKYYKNFPDMVISDEMMKHIEDICKLPNVAIVSSPIIDYMYPNPYYNRIMDHLFVLPMVRSTLKQMSEINYDSDLLKEMKENIENLYCVFTLMMTPTQYLGQQQYILRYCVIENEFSKFTLYQKYLRKKKIKRVLHEDI